MKAVLVTTEYRGVFFGLLDAECDERDKTLVLHNCRNIIYWAGTRGFLGLAAEGPEGDSRLGSTAVRVLIHGVTSVTDVSEQARAKLESWQ